jgi:hypothetical protein
MAEPTPHIEEEPGQLVESNISLTYKLRQLEAQTKALHIKIRQNRRVKHVLDTTSNLIPEGALLDGIIIVPETLVANKTLRLPAPEALVTNSMARGYEFDVRNDSRHVVTLRAEDKGITLDANDGVGPSGGSRWYLEIVCTEKGKQAYEITRLH